MKLSIISPSINSSKKLKEFLDDLREQSFQDFEVILVLAKSNKTIFQTIEKNLSFFGTRLKFIVNNKNRSIQSDIVCSFHLVESPYTMVMFSGNKIRSWYLDELTKNLDEYNVDIYEFKPRLIGTIRWKPKTRLEPLKVYDITKEPEFVAYSFPFIFNKIFKKKLVQKFIKFHFNKEISDTKFCLELNYFLLINAKTYLYEDRRVIREFIDSSISLNPTSFLEQFQNVINYVKVNDLKLSYELEYAYIYFLQIVLASFLSIWKLRPLSGTKVFADYKNYEEKRTSKYLNSVIKKLNSQHEKNQIFFDTNIYINKPSTESNYLKCLPNFKKAEDILEKLQ